MTNRISLVYNAWYTRGALSTPTSLVASLVRSSKDILPILTGKVKNGDKSLRTLNITLLSLLVGMSTSGYIKLETLVAMMVDPKLIGVDNKSFLFGNAPIPTRTIIAELCKSLSPEGRPYVVGFKD